MSTKITNITAATVPHGNGIVHVVRWEYNGKPRHMSTFASPHGEAMLLADVTAKLEERSAYPDWLASYGA